MRQAVHAGDRYAIHAAGLDVPCVLSSTLGVARLRLCRVEKPRLTPAKETHTRRNKQHEATVLRDARQ